MTKLTPPPALDRNRPVGDIYGGEPVEGMTPRHYQDGHYFTGTGVYIYSDEGARIAPEAVRVERQVPTHTAVADDAEIAELLKDPAAADLLAMDREIIVAMVKQAGGPVLSGDTSQRAMAAWLIKYTMAPAPGAQSLISDEDAAAIERERHAAEQERIAAEERERQARASLEQEKRDRAEGGAGGSDPASVPEAS